MGDRYVAEAMRYNGALIGGEQSGHIIFRERATTGDGLITTPEVLNLYLHYQKPFSEIAHPFEPYPQKLITIPVRDKHAWQTHPDIQAQICAAEQLLGTRGRSMCAPRAPKTPSALWRKLKRWSWWKQR